MPAPKKNTLNDITKRFGITAREARDIATAIGTLSQAPSSKRLKEGASNLGKQIKEVGTAAVKGKSGTTSNRAGDLGYVKGKKR